MKDKIVPLAIGIILAAVATFMIKSYLDEQKKEMIQQTRETVISMRENQSAVFVARRDIRKGVPIQASLVDTAVLDKRNVNPKAVRYFSEIENKSTAKAIRAGEQITTDALRTTRIEAGGPGGGPVTFSMVIPEGKRAVSVSVDNVASIVHMMRPGDHVDVFAIIAFPLPGQQGKQLMNIPLFQDVEVLAVGDQFSESKLAKVGSSIKKLVNEKKKDEKKKKAANNPAITLALDPQEANIISFVQEEGKVRLALRSPNDTSKVNYRAQVAQQQVAPLVTTQSFFQYLAANGLVTLPKPKPTAPPKPKGPQVEIYRGQEKEVKTLRK
ncbi:MAG: Flp pilus assembly protein CpaB [Candidatus Omnitrophica bacterium]|nr:Flp pilus assembly protein CpaB [Candidatus Omnitrophota bacterium]